MVSALERMMSRRQVDKIVSDDEIEIVIIRRARIDTPGGGWKWGPPTNLEPQKCALVPFKRRMTEYLVDTNAGEVPDLPFVLLARFDFNVQRGDQFYWEGQLFKVETVEFTNRDEKIAAHVDYVGEPNDPNP